MSKCKISGEAKTPWSRALFQLRLKAATRIGQHVEIETPHPVKGVVKRHIERAQDRLLTAAEHAEKTLEEFASYPSQDG